MIIRVAHLGSGEPVEVLSALAGMELVLLEMGYPVEPGAAVSAAQRVFAQSVGQPVHAG
jgi:aspartate aminotransferase-like enzyme